MESKDSFRDNELSYAKNPTKAVSNKSMIAGPNILAKKLLNPPQSKSKKLVTQGTIYNVTALEHEKSNSWVDDAQ